MKNTLAITIIAGLVIASVGAEAQSDAAKMPVKTHAASRINPPEPACIAPHAKPSAPLPNTKAEVAKYMAAHPPLVDKANKPNNVDLIHDVDATDKGKAPKYMKPDK